MPPTVKPMAAVSEMSHPLRVSSSVDGSARNVATETTVVLRDKTVTVVFASLALVPTLVSSVKVNVVVPEPALGVKTTAWSSLVIAAAVPDPPA